MASSSPQRRFSMRIRARRMPSFARRSRACCAGASCMCGCSKRSRGTGIRDRGSGIRGRRDQGLETRGISDLRRLDMAENGISRRAFLEGTGALVVSFAMSPLTESLAAGQAARNASAVDPRRLESWLAVAADGRVTAHTGKCELGQGMYTAQLQLIAEELSVPIDRI